MSKNLLNLLFAAVPHSTLAPIALRLDLTPLSLHFDPVVVAEDVVSEQRRRLVEIEDHEVQVAIVIEIAHAAAAAGVRRGNTRTGVGAVQQFFKSAVSKITKQDARAAVGKLRQLLFHFRINAAGDPKQIGPAIIVQVLIAAPQLT